MYVRVHLSWHTQGVKTSRDAQKDREAMRSNAPVSGQAHSNVEKPIAVAGELVQHVKERRYIDECVIIGLHDESCVIV